jgi:Na+/H+ antiporter NhaA
MLPDSGKRQRLLVSCIIVRVFWLAQKKRQKILILYFLCKNILWIFTVKAVMHMRIVTAT